VDGHGASGPQKGTGSPDVAEAWLITVVVDPVDSETAAAPPRTKVKAKARMTNFIVSNLYEMNDGDKPT